MTFEDTSCLKKNCFFHPNQTKQSQNNKRPIRTLTVPNTAKLEKTNLLVGFD